MKRYVSLEEISDGKLYQAKDLVRADCLGCLGCSQCCHGMGDSVVLDPLDTWRITTGLRRDLPALLQEGSAALGVVDGIVLPHLAMTKAQEACAFLDEDGRCSIHELRPGICRLFPLGRYYDAERFWYILQTEECGRAKAKIRVADWLDTPDLPRYETFVLKWHHLLKQAQTLIEESGEEPFEKNLSLFLLKTFYMTPYAPGDFYEQYRKREEIYRGIVPDGC